MHSTARTLALAGASAVIALPVAAQVGNQGPPRGVLTMDVSLRNALNTSYRSFMSRYKEFALAPGRMLVLRVAMPL